MDRSRIGQDIGRRGLVLAALLGCVSVPVPAGAQTLVDGEYACMIGSAMLGQIRITGDTYAGPAYDGAYEAEYPFTLDGTVILWGGPLGGISAAGEVVSTVLGDAGGGQVGFDITIENDEGNFQTISCSPE